MMLSPARRPRPETRRVANITRHPEAPNALPMKGYYARNRQTQPPQWRFVLVLSCPRRWKPPVIQPDLAQRLRPNQSRVPAVRIQAVLHLFTAIFVNCPNSLEPKVKLLPHARAWKLANRQQLTPTRGKRHLTPPKHTDSFPPTP